MHVYKLIHHRSVYNNTYIYRSSCSLKTFKHDYRIMYCQAMPSNFLNMKFNSLINWIKIKKCPMSTSTVLSGWMSRWSWARIDDQFYTCVYQKIIISKRHFEQLYVHLQCEHAVCNIHPSLKQNITDMTNHMLVAKSWIPSQK